jgi:serine phosphatase RsbU (regulator of sigma subunit)
MPAAFRARTRFERNLFLVIVCVLIILGATSLASLMQARRGFERIHDAIWEGQQVEAMQDDLAFFVFEHLQGLAESVSLEVDRGIRNCGVETTGRVLSAVEACLLGDAQLPESLQVTALRLYTRSAGAWEVAERRILKGEGGESGTLADLPSDYDIHGRDLDRFAQNGRQPRQRHVGVLASMAAPPGRVWPLDGRVLVTFARTDSVLTSRWRRAIRTADAPSLGQYTGPMFRGHTAALLAALLIVGAAAVGIGRFLSARLTAPLADLIGSMRRVEAGDLSHRAQSRSHDEFALLVDSFNSMVASIERLNEETRETERMKKELEMGRQIQLRLLPQRLPELAGFDVYGANISSLEVSGDYYDIVPWGNAGTYAIAVGDVSGKGIPAALLMSSVRAWLHGQARSPIGGPAEWVGRLNDLLLESTEIATFVTFFLGLLDPSDGRFEYVNAGHNPPILIRGDGEVLELAEGGPIAGGLEGAEFRSSTVRLRSGDVLVLYTDGITEARSREDEEFGEDRLAHIARHSLAESAEGVARRIVSAVTEFSGLAHQEDDITLVVLKAQT